jgi:sulfofructose kinase
MKILGIGEAVIDKTVAVDGEHSTEIGVAHYDAGGPVLAALVLLSRLGANCSFVTSLGQDSEGEMIRNILAAEHITLIERLQDMTKQNTILVDVHTGQRQKIRGDIKHAPIKGLSPEFIRSFGTVIMDRHERSAFHEVVRSKNADCHLITDPSTEVSAFTKKMMRHTSCPIIPIESLLLLGANLSLTGALQAAYAVCAKPFVVTLGELGSLVYDGMRARIIPAVRTRVIDTNGAGDIYRGAFAYGRLQKWGLERCAMYANVAAALQCAKQGNAAAIPCQEEITTLLGSTTLQHVDMAMVESRFFTLHEEASPEGDSPAHGPERLYTIRMSALAVN